MRHIGIVSTGIALCLSTLFGVASATTLDYQGFAFETGGFLPSDPGDSLWIACVATSLGPGLGFDPATEEVTALVSGLVSTGPHDSGDGVISFPYGPGRFEIYRDPAQDHDYGSTPPNATSPSSFTNGTLCLGGALTDFVLYFDQETGTGAYQGNVVFDTGSCLAELSASHAEGFTFGGVMTRRAVGERNMPVGYDLSVDGYLEAQKVPEAGCQFACFGIHEARLDFPRRPQADFGPKDGKFRIEGHFLPCNTDSVLDPATVDVRVGIGDYVQELPAGLLEAERHHTSWSFENHHAVEAITEFELERHRNGQWEFVIEGRGIPRATLIGNDNLLELELVIGTASGSDQVTLVQKKHKLRFKGDDDECEPEGDGDDDHLMPQQPPPTTIATTTLLGASPNPFNATTQIVVNSVSAGNLRLRIFDVRGRLVRTLHDGALPTGMHQFTWKGDDEQGRGVASGVYVYRLEAAGVAESRKLVVAK